MLPACMPSQVRVVSAGCSRVNCLSRSFSTSPQGAHLALGQTGQRHQFGGDGEGIDAACLPRIEVGADAAAIIVGVLLGQLVHLFPSMGMRRA